jgi:carbon monoxide dehydrogenase subunit G
MKVTGQALLHAPIERVWVALNDPAILARTIPGCERLETTGADQYAMTVSAGVASIKGKYAGRVALRDQRRPNSFVLSASGAGAPGTVDADVFVTLTEVDDGTRLDYEADATVGGVVGGVGQRMLVGVAKKMAGEFFNAVDDVLTGAQVGVGPAPDDIARMARAEPAGAGVEGVFVGTRRSGAVPGSGRGFLAGVLVGAAIALLGVLVGSWRRGG